MTEDNQKMLFDLTEDFCRRAQLYGCDAIQVLMSVHSDSVGTMNRSFGRGNWYARQGMAHEFITQEDARVCEFVKDDEFGDDDG